MITTATAGYINRDSSSWFDPRLDWTKLMIVRLNSGVTTSINPWLYSNDNTYAEKYVNLANSAAGVEDLVVQTFDGSTTLTTMAKVAVVGTDYNIAITYVAATHTLSFIVDEVLVGTIASNLSAFSPATSDFHLNDSFSDSVISIGYERLFQRVLSISEINAEQASIAPVSSTSLLSSCPLQTSIDLTDHNGNNHQFTASGTVTTDIDDPLLSVVAAPPSNIDANTATLITYDSAVFQDTLTAGAATDVWHKAIAIAGDKVWGACSFGDTTTYKPDITVFDGLANALANTQLIRSADNKPVQFQVTAGNTYYFKSTRNGAVANGDLKLSILRGLTLPVPVGSLAIPDVTDGFPLAFLSATNGYPINWVNDFPAGEEVGILANGKVLTEFADDNNTKLWDTQINLLATPTAAASRFQIAGSNETQFIIGKGFGGADQFVLCDEFGNVGATTYSIGAGGLHSNTLSPDSTIAYILQNVALTNQEIKKFVLATSTLSTFVAGVANYVLAPNVICLPNGNVIAGYNRSGVDNFVRVFSSAAATVLTKTLNADDGIERLALDTDTNTYFWVWTQPSAEVSYFRKIKISDGSVTIDLPGIYKYDDGKYQGAETNTPVRFGHSFSCPLWIVKVALFPVAVARSGLYTVSGTGAIDATKVASGEGTGAALIRHDQNWIDTSLGTSENVKIPDPYYDTFLAGDE